MKLKSGLRVLWRGPEEAQIGCDPQLAHLIRLEHPREFDVLQMLEQEQHAPHLRRLLEEAGGARERVDHLIRELADAGLMQASHRNRSSELEVDPERRDLLAAEAESRCLMAGNGWRELARRQDRCVSIYGLGRTGAHIALGLATAGVGRLQLSDPSPVTARDRGQVFQRRHIGMTRAEAVADVIAEHDLFCCVRIAGPWRRPQAGVLVDYEVTDPNRSAYFAMHGIPHLSVVVGELDISCGPWVAGQGGPCLRCLRLWAADDDPGWPGLATQRFARSAVAARGEDSCLAATVGSIAVNQVVQGLHGARPITTGRTMTVGLPAYEIAWRKVDSHPRCDHHQADRRRSPRGHTPPPPKLALPPAP
ncbi:MAG: ThiF family adenylyltransferase [Bifidobacteriaceae bacterium]|jgi:hypothetical protein|nr:ThiF family adenylyltransferase [Bifidobacteriaceae bacterium]